MPSFIDLSGRKFGRLEVLRRIGTTDYGQPQWECQCDCGSDPVSVFGNALRSGASTSCGCLHRERVTKHGKVRTLEYTVWQMMSQRCLNDKHTSYPDYGGRGIVVCDRWTNSFANFIEDIGPRPSASHTLERKDNDGPYAPENCYWATGFEQGSNKRNNRRLTRNGESRTVAEWTRRLGIPKSTILNRLARGASDEEALITRLSKGYSSGRP